MAIKASDNFKTYRNPNGPTITTGTRPVIEADGLYFKDIDGSCVVSPVNDWRLTPAERAAAVSSCRVLINNFVAQGVDNDKP